nr:AMP-binding protein [Hyphomonas sp. Mor2]
MDDLIQSGMLSALYAARKPDQVAVTDYRTSRTFLELHENANRLANAFTASGIQAGDSVALICGNRVEFVESLLASLRTGVRLTPVNWHLSQDEALYIVSDCDAKLVIAEQAILESWKIERIDDVDGISIDGAIGEFRDYQSTLAEARSDDPMTAQHGTVMLYTSGTTGKPKGVYRKGPTPVPPQLSDTLADFNPESDAQLVCGPMYHAAPLLFDVAWPLASGVRLHLLERWDSHKVLDMISTHKITHAHMVPIMFQRLLALPDGIRHAADLSSLKKIYHGAAPCPAAVKRAMIDWVGPIIYEYYAGSEGGAGFLISSAEWLDKPGSVGRVPNPDAVMLLDAAGQPVAPGAEGEIYHRINPDDPFEYYKAPEKTADKIKQGYFTLGDVGRVDADGYLFLTGRSAECIISGGVNIYPAEIDEVIAAHPLVADVCVIGAPNPEWGEEVRAVVQLADGATGNSDTEASILAHTRETLSGFKVPKKIDFVGELPRLPSGKVPRARVRARYWQDQATQI